MIQVVFFDAGNTLLQAHPPVQQRYSQTAACFGVTAEPGEILGRFRTLWPACQEERQQRLFKADREGTKAFWHDFVARVFAPWMSDFTDFDGFFNDLYLAFARQDAWRLYDDVPETLAGLKAAGCGLAVVSNWDHRLEGILQSLDISRYFDAIIISALVGVEKPVPRIFHLALSRFPGVNARDVLHVGDSMHDDVRGALAAGLQAAHIRRHDAAPAPLTPDPITPCLHLDSLRDLLPLVAGK